MSTAKPHLSAQLEVYAGTAHRAGKAETWSAHLSRWPVYAAATGAALAMATSADAGIITGNANTSISVSRTTGLGGTNVSHTNKAFVTFGSLGKLELYVRFYNNPLLPASDVMQTGQATLKPLSGAEIFAKDTNHFSFSELVNYRFGAVLANARPTGNATLGSGTPVPYPQSQGSGQFIRYHGSVSVGSFASGVPGYAGFRLNNGDLGWIQLTWSSSQSDGYPDQLSAGAWAYNTVADQPIAAGVAPEPGTLPLSLLAFGATGILAWRKRRGQAHARP